MKTYLTAMLSSLLGLSSDGPRVHKHKPRNTQPRKPTRRIRLSRVKQSKFCKAGKTPAPWLPNVKGFRYQGGRSVARSN